MLLLELIFVYLTILSAKDLYISNERKRCESAPIECDGSLKNPFGTIYSALIFVERNWVLINSEEEGCTLKLLHPEIDEPFLLLDSEIKETYEFSPFSKIKGNSPSNI